MVTLSLLRQSESLGDQGPECKICFGGLKLYRFGGTIDHASVASVTIVVPLWTLVFHADVLCGTNPRACRAAGASAVCVKTFIVFVLDVEIRNHHLREQFSRHGRHMWILHEFSFRYLKSSLLHVFLHQRNHELFGRERRVSDTLTRNTPDRAGIAEMRTF